MTDHRHTLRAFLQADLHRLEGALDEQPWTPARAARLTDFLRFSAQLGALLLEGSPPDDPMLRARWAGITPRSMAEALDLLTSQIETFLAAIRRVDDGWLHAPVLDSQERGLSVLGHLYDFCRTTARLVEWSEALRTRGDEGTDRTVEGWFDE